MNTTATATPRRSRAAEFFGKDIDGGLLSPDGKKYPTRPEGVSDAVAEDIAERRRRTSTKARNSEVSGERIWDRRVQRPDGPGIYDTFCKPRGMSLACATCTRHIEVGANCPGRDPAGDGQLRFLPDCHGVHDGDRAAVRRAMDQRETA